MGCGAIGGVSSTESQCSVVDEDIVQTVGNIKISSRYHMLPRRVEEDYSILTESVGSGFNGYVHKAINKTTKDTYAAKPFKIRGLSKKSMEELRMEVSLFLRMDHPHVARLIDVYEGQGQLILLMELLEGGELYDRISRKKKFTERDAATASWQMLVAINYLHSQSIVHRDIKLENFLYDTMDSNHLKLIDFGFSRLHNKTEKKMMASCGTLAYMAPEVLKGVGYTNKCDMWSLGCVTFILLMGYMPFPSQDTAENIETIIRGEYSKNPKVWNRLSNDAKDFVHCLLQKSVNSRLSSAEALQHPFMQKREQASDEVDSSIVSSIVDFAQASSFKRACMSMMAWSLTNAQRREVRQAFLEIDEDKSGTISVAQLKTALESKMDISDEEITKVFASFGDSACHEQIYYSDFLAAMTASRIAIHDDLIFQAFQRFDRDKSGFITKENLVEVLGEDGYGGSDADELIKEADLAGDGRISLQEFITYMRGSDASEKTQVIAGRIIEEEMENETHDNRRRRLSCAVPRTPSGV
mmetsp:Transcript_88214/g.248279  ORF Transcript_88214/g.248279 Transcript_88214/m.248279 type:complete len:527 (-) Transcript_88214:120-1700(-)